MSEEQYKKQIEVLLKALKPFAHFAFALKVAQEPNGYAWVTLANGSSTYCEAEDSEQTLYDITPNGYIVSCHASLEKEAVTFHGGSLQAKHFFDADTVFNTITYLNEGTENA